MENCISNVKSCFEFLTPHVNSVISNCSRLFYVYFVCFFITKTKILFRISPSKTYSGSRYSFDYTLFFYYRNHTGSNCTLPLPSLSESHWRKLLGHITSLTWQTKTFFQNAKKSVLLSLTTFPTDSHRVLG